MSALEPGSPDKTIILYGLLGNEQISKSSFPGISIQVCMPDIMRRRIAKLIDQAQHDSSIPFTNLHKHLHDVLESFCRDFVLLRDFANGNRVKIICIVLNPEVISLIQTVYPPSECISYDIINTMDDAMVKYADYFEILSAPSSTTSSATCSPHHILDAFDDRISTIPLKDGRVIYLGSDSGANNFAKLTELGITHILNVSDTLPNYYEGTTNITYMRVPITDCGTVILCNYFPAVFKFINNALDTGGRILVHCFAGKSRSASFVIAYFMQYQNMNYMDAFKHVQTHRAVIEPNFGFELQLHAFETSCTTFHNNE